MQGCQHHLGGVLGMCERAPSVPVSGVPGAHADAGARLPRI